MGANCLSSLRRNNERNTEPKEGKQENFALKETGLASVDALFADAKDPLQLLARLRKSLFGTYSHLQKATSAVLLTEPTLEDSVMAMLYEYSASSDGHLDRVGFDLDDDEPFVKVDKDSLRPEYKDVAHAWNEFVEALMEAGPKLVKLEGELQELVERCADTPERAHEEAGDLGPLDAMKAVKATTENLNKLKAAPDVVRTSIEFQVKLVEELQALVKGKLREAETLDQVKAIGKEAHAAEVFEPKKLVATYWPEKARINQRAK